MEPERMETPKGISEIPGVKTLRWTMWKTSGVDMVDARMSRLEDRINGLFHLINGVYWSYNPRIQIFY